MTWHGLGSLPICAEYSLRPVSCLHGGQLSGVIGRNQHGLSQRLPIPLRMAAEGEVHNHKFLSVHKDMAFVATVPMYVALSLCVSVRSWGCDTAEHGICSHVALASRPCRCGTSLDFSNWTIIALKQFWFDPMHCENRIRVEEQTPHLFPLYSAPTPKTPAQSLSQVALASDPIMIATAVTTTKGCKNSRIIAIRRMPSSSR